MPKPTKPIRWTRQAAAAEFGLDAQTLSNRLLAASISAGDDGRFSTKQILAAIMGDRGAELTGKTRAEKENWQLRNEVIRKTRIPLEIVEQINDEVLSNVAGAIKAREDKVMTRAAIEELFAELRGIGAAIQKWKAEP
jgi:hypothetical protein